MPLTSTTQQPQVAQTASTPNSPSIQNIPTLEFTITSTEPNGMYRTANTNGGGINGATGPGGESLPPSPQSQQHSCINSPQGSPGPLTISPQDLNPFTSNTNYDIMHNKLASFKVTKYLRLN